MTDLESSRIEAELTRFGSTIGRPIVVKDLTESTNDDARRAAAQGAPHGAVIVADAQTKGRGRSGHSWHSPPGQNLYLSIVLRPNIPPMDLPPLTLAMGVCVARIVDDVLGDPGRASIKWPNDVYVGSHKLAGILVESILRGATIDAVIVGVGINVHTEVFPDELKATSLRLLGAPTVDRSEIVARLLTEVGLAVRSFESQRLQPFLVDLGRRNMLRGRSVEIAGVEGIVTGIDADGFLSLVDASGTLHRIGSGSVNFR